LLGYSQDVDARHKARHDDFDETRRASNPMTR
jgi:hypothetical protein